MTNDAEQLSTFNVDQLQGLGLVVLSQAGFDPADLSQDDLERIQADPALQSAAVLAGVLPMKKLSADMLIDMAQKDPILFTEITDAARAECRYRGKMVAFCQIRPMFENAWTRAKLGPFVNRLPTELSQDFANLQAHLATLPNNGREFCFEDFVETTSDRLVTAYDFIFLLFNIKPAITVRRGEPAVDRILEIISEAEDHLLHHVVRSTNPKAKLLESAGAYKLVMSQIQTTHKTRSGKFPNSKNKALFSILDFATELDAAGVQPFNCVAPQDDDTDLICRRYRQLPLIVKEMFFAASPLGKLRKDIPLYIVRDFILFAADGGRWEKLKQACDKDKQQGTQDLAEFLCDFLEYQRNTNNVSLGAAKKSRPERDPASFNQRELAYLEICKPHKWLGKLWRENPSQSMGN